MTKQELLAIANPILFNTEMVRAILNGNKTVTRRVVNPHNKTKAKKLEYSQSNGLWIDETHIKDYTISPCWIEKTDYLEKYARYKVGDTLYVREAWQEKPIEIGGGYFYKEEAKKPNNYSWTSSIHMPKQAARIFLRVTDVRVERLQDMNGYDLEKEGIKTGITHFKSPINNYGNAQRYEEALATFADLWDSTVKKADIDRYSWIANPWVWVIEFERVNENE